MKKQPPPLPVGWEYRHAEPSHLDRVVWFYPEKDGDAMPCIVVTGPGNYFREIVRTADGMHLGHIDFLCVHLDGVTNDAGVFLCPQFFLYLARPWPGMGTEVWTESLCRVDVLKSGLLRDDDPDFIARIHHYLSLPDMVKAYTLAGNSRLRPIIDRTNKRDAKRFF